MRQIVPFLLACVILAGTAIAPTAARSAPASTGSAAGPAGCIPSGPPASYTLGSIDIEGIHYGGVPAEPAIAVGPHDIFCLGPGDVRIFDKTTGALLRDQCENVFFQTSTGCLTGADPVIGDGGGLIDPDCCFDRIAQRFVAVCFSFTGTGGGHVQSHLHIAVSQTADPLGPWRFYHLSTTTHPIAPGFTFVPDRPSVGVSLDKIGIASHMVSYDGGPEFTLWRVIDRDNAYNGNVPDISHPDSLNYRDFVDFDTTSFNYRVGRNVTADATLHSLSVGWAWRNTALYRGITGPAAACVMSDTTSIGLRYPGMFSTGRRAPQLSTATKVLNNLDTMPNPSSLWVRKGLLSIAWQQPYPLCPPDTVSVLRILRVRATPNGFGGTFLTAPTDTIYGDPASWYTFPAICDDSLGRLYLGFLASSPTIYPSCFITAQQRGETSLETGPTLVKAGQKAWTRSDGSGNVGRWGDFTNIDLDESSWPPVAYYVGQWGKPGVTSSVDSLGTWIRSFYFDPAAGVPPRTGPGSEAVNLSWQGAWPNPARREVRVAFALQREARVLLEVTDVAGRRVRVLSDRALEAGTHVFTWDGRDDAGNAVGAGVYLCRVTDGVTSSRGKLSLLR